MKKFILILICLSVDLFANLKLEIPDPSYNLYYVHGIQSNHLWFKETAESIFERCKCNVYSFDRRRNVDSYETWLNDIHDHLIQIYESNNKPIVLFGNSFGTRLVMAYLKLYRPVFVSKVILEAPAFKESSALKLRKMNILKHSMSSLLNLNFRVAIPLKDNWFTDDKEKLAWIKSDDSKSLRSISLRESKEIVNMTKYYEADGFEWYDFPTLVLFASKDKMFNNNESKLQVLDKLSSKVEINYYPTQHYIMFDPIYKVQAIDDILRFSK